MIEAVIFDMDGMLFSTEPLYYQCYREAALQGYGVDFPFDLFVRCVGISIEEASKILENYFGSKVNVPELYRQCARNFENYMRTHHIPLKPGAAEALEFFHKRGLKIALATSNIRSWAEQLLKQGGIRAYFSEIVTSEEVSRPKPDPEVYLRAAQQVGADVGACLAFDDSIAGATAAISAGMRTVVIPDLKQPDTFVREHAFRIYTSLKDIYPDIDELLG